MAEDAIELADEAHRKLLLQQLVVRLDDEGMERPAGQVGVWGRRANPIGALLPELAEPLVDGVVKVLFVVRSACATRAAQRAAPVRTQRVPLRRRCCLLQQQPALRGARLTLGLVGLVLGRGRGSGEPRRRYQRGRVALDDELRVGDRNRTRSARDAAASAPGGALLGVRAGAQADRGRGREGSHCGGAARGAHARGLGAALGAVNCAALCALAAQGGGHTFI